MPKYGLIVCFSPVIKVEWVNISSTGTGSQKLGVGKWKKIGVLAIQKVAKTGNIGKKKKLQWQAISIMLDTSACRIKRDYAWNDTRLKVNKH